MSILSEFKRLVHPYGEDDDEEFLNVSQRSSSRRETPDREEHRTQSKTLNVHTTTQLEVVVMRPEKVNDVNEIIDNLKDLKTVFLNLEKTKKEESLRILDILSGFVLCQGGNIKPAAKLTYIITPFNVNIVGSDFMSEINSKNLFDEISL